RQVAEQRRIVDEALHPAERAFGGAHQIADGGAVGHVASQADGLAAGLFDGRQRRLRGLQIAQREPLAFRGQRLGIGGSDPLRRPGDDDRPSVQASHSGVLRYFKLSLVSGMIKAPIRNITEMPKQKIASMLGRSAGVGESSDTKVGMMPPIAKPMFQESPVPVA